MGASMGAMPVARSSGGGLLAGGILTLLMALGSFGFAASEFSDADRADRWASERSSSSYGSYGLGSSFWYARARTDRSQGAMGIGGGAMLLMASIAMLVARSKEPPKNNIVIGPSASLVA